MKILLYNPDNGVTRNFMPHLWMFLLKALTPPEHEVILIDGNCEPMNDEELVRFAQEHHCHEVVLDNAPKGGMLSIFGLGSIGSQVRHLMQTQASDVTAPEVSGST